MFTNPVPPFRCPPPPPRPKGWCPKCCSSTCFPTKYRTDTYEIHYDHKGLWKYQAHFADKDCKYYGSFLWSVKLKAYLGERKSYRDAIKVEKKKAKLTGNTPKIKATPRPNVAPKEEYDEDYDDSWSNY